MEPVFVCGHRKTGTTMFLNLLEGHSKLLVYPIDLNMMYAYFPQYTDGSYSVQQCKDRLKRVVFAALKRRLAGKDIDIEFFEKEFFSFFDDEKITVTKYLIEKLIAAFSLTIQKKCTNKVKTIPTIKETSIEIYANEIFDWFPNAKFLHLVRDPRDNFAALKAGINTWYARLGENNKETLMSLLNRAKLGLEFGLLNQKRYGEDRYKIIKFEDLVSKPREVLSEVCFFMGIAWEDSLLLPTVLGVPTGGNNFEGKEFYKISKYNVGRWRERISKEEGKIIEYYLGDIMEKYGYKKVFNEFVVADSVMKFYKWQNYRYFYKDTFGG